MKKFARSNGGKTLVFILCVLLLCVAAAGIASFAIMTAEGFYITDGEVLYQEFFPEGAAEWLSEPELHFLKDIFWFLYQIRNLVLPVGLAALLLGICCFVSLMCTAGRRPEDEEIHAGVFKFLPSDLILAGSGAALFFCFWMIFDEPFVGGPFFYLLLLCLGTLGAVTVFTGTCTFAASRLKQGTFFTNTIIWFGCRLLWNILKYLWTGFCNVVRAAGKGLKKMPLIWKTVAGAIFICAVELLALVGSWNTEDYLFFWFIEKLILLPAVFYVAYLLKRLAAGGEALAEGDLSYQTNTKGMFWDFKKHGENLNSIAIGLSKAVEERTKSERMKAELITNVSHDIKTPLTSIISYADLISKEECENEKIKEYSQVLLRQSEKLKRLTEDLVEASKASTGNLEILLAPCDAGVLLTQVAGEYEQKLADADLTLVTSQPDQPVHIMADGRRLWRVFDNLMNNICKYSMAGTRVYLDLQERAGQAIITFRNTSAAALNIAPEELMERFVRGDESRNTEGNGLGLSIAKSLTELQGGIFEIKIDGDLFKVLVCFPAIK